METHELIDCFTNELLRTDSVSAAIKALQDVKAPSSLINALIRLVETTRYYWMTT